MNSNIQISAFDEDVAIHHLKHYLPAQAPLKDFVHHNTLHAFQDLPFFEGIRKASANFGFKVTLQLSEYRKMYKEQKINDGIINRVIVEEKGAEALQAWRKKLLSDLYVERNTARVGYLREQWKKHYKLDMDNHVHPRLFRILCSYLDQGISIWSFPYSNESFLAAIRKIEKNSFSSFFKTQKARKLLFDEQLTVKDLLGILAGNNEDLYQNYLFDQQFAHQGWSGIVSTIEDHPKTLMAARKITLKELIHFELLMEIDVVSHYIQKKFKPLSDFIEFIPETIDAPVVPTELDEVLMLWQKSFEWSYYDQAIGALQSSQAREHKGQRSFQAFFCIDDRECSLRRNIEQIDPDCETFGTPGFFGVEFFYQPENGKFYSKVCPVPVNPKYLIKEKDTRNTKHRKIIHFNKHSHSFAEAWLMSHTVGFLSALELVKNIFKPTNSSYMSSSFEHMDPHARLTIEHQKDFENGLQIGFTVEEMAVRVEGTLKSIGLVKNFAPIIYVIGHGASSVNNPHYAAYDCGACSGKAGSVNARAFSYMANHQKVRAILAKKGIVIPDTTYFIGGLHDTTRDDITLYDLDILPDHYTPLHQNNNQTFTKALELNAQERSRRFESINSELPAEKIRELIRQRSVSLFEPRPELNHATNALCVIGRRALSKCVFLDRRSFLNSYDYQVDPSGDYLFNILKAATPVCGGINLEYYFSRVDNQKLGAGSKLPHNVMGLIGVANGNDGDLRPGLPSQMVEIHDPVRMMFIVEQQPDVVLNVIRRTEQVYEWYINEWVLLVVLDPITRQAYRFDKGTFVPYHVLQGQASKVNELQDILIKNKENLPVFHI